MVSLREAQAANAALKDSQPAMTAVFAGATNGIGLATLKAFAKHTPQGTAIIVGRNKARFEPELQKLRSTSPNGTFTFLETDITLLKNVDAVSEEIKKATQSIDLLCVSQGFLNFGGRENTSEGLDLSTVLRYYGRVRFIQNLLPVMTKNARVITVLAGGWEGKIFEDDLDLERNYSFLNANAQYTAMTTLSNDKFAEQNPDRGFLHVYPGVVNTGMVGRTSSGILGFFLTILEKLMSYFVIQPDEIGERMLNLGTTPQFAKGSWSLNYDGEAKNNALLVEAREKGLADKVVEHNQRIFERATSS